MEFTEHVFEALSNFTEDGEPISLDEALSAECVIAGSSHPGPFDSEVACQQVGWKAASATLKTASQEHGFTSSKLWGTREQWNAVRAFVRPGQEKMGQQITVTRQDVEASRWLTETFVVFHADQVEYVNGGVEDADSIERLVQGAREETVDAKSSIGDESNTPEALYCCSSNFRCRL